MRALQILTPLSNEVCAFAIQHYMDFNRIFIFTYKNPTLVVEKSQCCIMKKIDFCSRKTFISIRHNRN